MVCTTIEFLHRWFDPISRKLTYGLFSLTKVLMRLKYIDVTDLIGQMLIFDGMLQQSGPWLWWWGYYGQSQDTDNEHSVKGF